MLLHIRVYAILLFFCILVYAACSGGGTVVSTSGQGSESRPELRLLTPSKIMLGSSIIEMNVYGNNFMYWDDKIGDYIALPLEFKINNETVTPYYWIVSPTEIGFRPNSAHFDQSGSYEIEISNEFGTSNALNFEIYTPVQGPLPFDAVPAYLTAVNADSPRNIIASDLNGDNLADIVVPSESNDRFFILNGKADGTLDASRYIALPYSGIVASGDINGDQANDLLLASRTTTTPTIAVMTNDGSGGLQLTSTMTVPGRSPGVLLLEDMNGDEQKDLLISSSDPAGIYLVLNNNATFGVPEQLPTLSTFDLNFSIADMNKDGRKDILYRFFDTNTSQYEIHLLLQQQDGTFSDHRPIGLAETDLYASIIDFDLDGYPDLAVQTKPSAMEIQLEIYKNLGNGSFESIASQSIPPPYGRPEYPTNTRPDLYKFVAVDLDNDGDSDLVGNNNYEFVCMWGNGSGQFTPQWIAGTGGWIRATPAVGDVNGDEISDVVVAARDNRVSVLLGRKDRNQPSPVSLYPYITGRPSAADVNDDGFKDLFFPGDGDYWGSTVYINSGSEDFNEHNTLFSPSGSMIADLNHDGYAEMIGTDREKLMIWPGNEHQIFDDIPIEVNIPFNIVTLQTADMDRDGQLDLVAGGPDFNGFIVYMTDEWSFELHVEDFSGPFVIEDFNSDGLTDIASIYGALLGTGNRAFQLIGTFPYGGSFYFNENRRVGDFNRDGHPDIVEENGIYYGNGDGTFYLQNTLYYGERINGILVRDFNDDGQLDILANLQSENFAVLFTNDGLGRFRRSYFGTGTDGRYMTEADLNNDQIPDLVFTNDAVVIFGR